ncbi:MAG TPA: hypothetical protein PLF13_09495 [candidate division Zixibacteria bacterium]|nr:hypothetical protein [candidate division Zixibacteria bacterium]
MSDLNLYSVNWQDGMLLTQRHLKDQERYCEELARWYAVSAGDNYGLIRKSLAGKPALLLEAMAGSGKLQVDLIRCQAITPDGSVIEINEGNEAAVHAETDLPSGSVAVYVAIGQPAKKPVGDPDPDEDPPRIPSLAGNYSLHIGQAPSLPRGQYLQIAQLAVDGNEVAEDPNFFPPCLSLYADERLLQKAGEYRNRLENLLSLASRAYTAIAAEGAMSSEKSSLQASFRQTIFQFAYHMSASLDQFVVGHNAPAPIELVIFFKRLFRVLTTLLNLQAGLKDYLNERFFVKEVGTNVGQFMSQVDSFLLADYDHQNIGGHLREIDTILSVVRQMMGFLAQVKKDQLGAQAVATDSLTYQGQTYRILDYGSVRLEQMGELSYLLVDISNPSPVADTVILLNKDLFDSGIWTRMQIRLGLNEARGLGETDPVEIDVTTYGSKVALHPQDMLKSPSVNQVTLIFRGAPDPSKFEGLSKMDLSVYSI